MCWCALRNSMILVSLISSMKSTNGMSGYSIFEKAKVTTHVRLIIMTTSSIFSDNHMNAP